MCRGREEVIHFDEPLLLAVRVLIFSERTGVDGMTCSRRASPSGNHFPASFSIRFDFYLQSGFIQTAHQLCVCVRLDYVFVCVCVCVCE